MAASKSQGDKPEVDDKNIRQLSQINFKICTQNLNDDIYADTKEKYKCIEIFKAENAEQKALYQVLTAGRKNNLPQLLSLFVSDYSRYRIKQFYKKNFISNKNVGHNQNKANPNRNVLSEDIWATKSKAVEKIVSAPINSGIPTLQAAITSAVTTHSKRMCRMMRFDNLSDDEKIDDSLGYFASYIIQGIALIKNQNWKPPCQVL